MTKRPVGSTIGRQAGVASEDSVFVAGSMRNDDGATGAGDPLGVELSVAGEALLEGGLAPASGDATGSIDGEVSGAADAPFASGDVAGDVDGVDVPLGALGRLPRMRPPTQPENTELWSVVTGAAAASPACQT
jgi:hypothetical protein